MTPTPSNPIAPELPCASSLWRLLGNLERLFGWSVGHLRVGGYGPRLPGVCVERCLVRGDEDEEHRGCAWLRRVVREGQIYPLPPGGRCDRGCHVRVAPGDDQPERPTIFALCPRDAADEPRGPDDEPQAARFWDEVLASVEQLIEQMTRREEENVRLVEEVLQNYEQLNLLFEVTRASITMARPEEMYDFALDRLSAALRASFACFLDAEGRFERTLPRFRQVTGLYDAYRRLLDEDARETLADAAAACTAHTITISQRQPRSPLRASLLVVPLVSGAESLGAAVFGRPVTETFQTGDCSMAEAVMGQVATTAHKIRLFQDLQQMSFDVVGALVNAIDAKDNYTGGHSDRVARWSVMLGQALNLGENDLQMLTWAGRLHDIGKIGVRDDVLGKPGKLTSEEFAHIKQHPVISYEVLYPIRRLAHVLDAVRHHHEAWNGSGYPDGLAGEQIPLEARIIQTADVFDALTSSRSYRAAYSVSKALSIMRTSAGTQLDPHMVEVFFGVVEKARQEQPDLFEHIPASEELDDVHVGGRA